MSQKTKLYISIAGGIILLALMVWAIISLFSGGSNNTANQTGSFSTSNTQSVSVSTNSAGQTQTNIPTLATGAPISPKKIFAIANGPIVGATFIELKNPTTTIARYIEQDNGHVFDLAIDVPGAAPQTISNTTIPGSERAVWLEQGNAALLQYLENNTIKTVYLGFPPLATTTNSVSAVPVRVQFFPDNIADIAASPSGTSVAYLMTTATGADGYIANSNGTGAKKLFSLPLSQVVISWPAQTTLIVTTKNALGVPGMVFSIDVKSGTVTPLLYGQDVTAIADKTFSHILYQTVSDSIGVPLSYNHAVKTGIDDPLPLNPFPEKCVWGAATSTILFCATPTAQMAANYLDLWHQGLSAQSENITSFIFLNGLVLTSTVAFPGSDDGGVQTDIAEMAVSPDDHYLSFISKGDRTLWGVRLTQQ
jgi:hypothetical protein